MIEDFFFITFLDNFIDVFLPSSICFRIHRFARNYLKICFDHVKCFSIPNDIYKHEDVGKLYNTITNYFAR